MKKNFLKYGLLSVALLTAACGNGDTAEEPAEDTTQETTEQAETEETTEETADDTNSEEDSQEDAESEEDTDATSTATQVEVSEAEDLPEAFSEDGAWIVLFQDDIETDEELTLAGGFQNNEGEDQRKLGLYTTDEEGEPNETFTLSAPSITIQNDYTRIVNGTVESDLIVEADQLTLEGGATVDGNIDFASQEYYDSADLEDGEVTGEITVEGEPVDEAAASEDGEEASGPSIRVSYDDPHGDQAFASAFVIMDGDTIADVVLDEYQFMEGDEWQGVPNDDADFGTNYDEAMTLISKRQNDEGYSELMAENADATLSYDENLQAIEDFAIGSTVEELEDAVAELEDQGEDREVSDVVSGATFVDTAGYLQTIIDTANDGMEFTGAENADLGNADLSYSLAAPHGEAAFAVVAVLHEGEQILAAAQDELQFVDPEEFEGVPNSDEAFGENFNDDVVLASKMENDEAYSQMMEEGADSTLTYSENMEAILDHASGSTVEEVEATISELEGLGEEDDVSDVVSGATFVDTAGYLQAVVDTVQE